MQQSQKLRKTKNIGAQSVQQTQPVQLIQDPIKILIGLLKLLMTPSIDSKTLINYIEQFNIDPNIYIPSIRDDVRMPLVYYCCSNSNLSEFFLYLIDKKVNLNADTSLFFAFNDIISVIP